MDNLAAVPSTLGGKWHGLSVIVISYPPYFQDTGHHFVYPTIPDNAPNTLMCASVAVELIMWDRDASSIHQLNTVITEAARIRKITTKLIEDVYLQAKKLPIMGLATINI